MKKRIRKKKHVAEFAEFGVAIDITLADGADYDLFLDTFITDAIEANGCHVGGGGIRDHFSGVIDMGRNADMLEEKLNNIVHWLDAYTGVMDYKIGEINDIWYGSFGELIKTALHRKGASQI